MQLINPKYPRINGVKQINQEKLLQIYIFYPIAKDPDPSKVWKCIKSYFFGFWLTFGI